MMSDVGGGGVAGALAVPSLFILLAGLLARSVHRCCRRRKRALLADEPGVVPKRCRAWVDGCAAAPSCSSALLTRQTVRRATLCLCAFLTGMLLRYEASSP